MFTQDVWFYCLYCLGCFTFGYWLSELISAIINKLKP